ncbi:MAG TPA: hypothetical protein ENI99_12905 [Sedimenticola sp.]|nr:hypothetical protein [Sedimenticola sp.]
MRKRQILTVLMALLALLTQGCNKMALERAIALGDNPDPDDPVSYSSAAKSKAPVCRNLVVLRHYCLGGRVKDLLASREPFRQKARDGKYLFDFREKYGFTTVAAFQGRILSVTRLIRPASWSTLRRLTKWLERDYGLPEDRSFFPPNAKTRKSREKAIYSKRGQVRLIWERLGWNGILVWKNMREIEITFLDQELNEIYQASRTPKR